MKRRLFLSAAASAALPSVAKAQSPSAPLRSTNLPTLRWRMATSWSKRLYVRFGSIDFLCQRVSAMTEGNFTITPYGVNEIASGLKVMDAVADGTVECGHTSSAYYIDKQPALSFAASIPFGLNAQQQLAWLQQGGLEAIQVIYRDFNIINFPAGSSGAQMGGWFKQKVTRVDDLKGLKMRIPGLGGEVMKRLGVDVQSLAGDEIYEHLERGDIEAAEWAGPHEDEKLGLNRVAGYYYYPGWWEPGSTYELQVNLSQWNQLPKPYQEVLKVTSLEAHERMLAEYDAANGAALQQLLTSGTQLSAFSSEILQAAQDAAFELYEETATRDDTFRQVYNQWQTFRTEISRWHRINEFKLNQFYATAALS